MNCNKKVSYVSKEDAESDIQRIIKRTNNEYRPTYAYECKECNVWHLTSLEKVNGKLSVKVQKDINKERHSRKMLDNQIDKLKKKIENLVNHLDVQMVEKKFWHLKVKELVSAEELKEIYKQRNLTR